MKFIFDIDHATKFGLKEAVMIQHLSFWIAKNKADNRNFIENRYWTYNSIDGFSKILSFWSPRQIQRILASLVRQQILKKGCFNKHRYDRTSWYAFINENEFITSEVIKGITNSHKKKQSNLADPFNQTEISKTPDGNQDNTPRVNPSNQAVRTIPDITNESIPDSTTPTVNNISSDLQFNVLWELYPSPVGKNKAFHHYKATIKTEEDFKNINIALHNYLQSERVTKGFIKNGSTWFNEWQDWISPTESMLGKKSFEITKQTPVYQDVTKMPDYIQHLEEQKRATNGNNISATT